MEHELEEKTKISYTFHTEHRIPPYFKDMHMDKIETLHITDHLAYHRTPEASINKKGKLLGSATIVYNYRVLRSIFAKAVVWRVLKENPIIGVKKPREDGIKEMEVYDE